MKIDTHNVCRVDEFVIVDVSAGEFIAGEGNKLLRVVVRAHHIRRVHQAVAVDIADGVNLEFDLLVGVNVYSVGTADVVLLFHNHAVRSFRYLRQEKLISSLGKSNGIVGAVISGCKPFPERQRYVPAQVAYRFSVDGIFACTNRNGRAFRHQRHGS